ncbi:cytochrome P450 71A1-like protein [Carex littledalei]|uniref:Cytochrome P450 71A1-like protein n=1 Tax=Carex littledalei TaxID=544730 RepID=A0A833R510_9POAL|nr:cytochrome P450 71A1-like protein [Carex littledalei]
MALQLVSLVVLLFILPLLSLLILHRLSNKESVIHRKPNLPPGPNKLPILGNLHQLGTSTHRSLHHLSLKYGPLMYLQLGQVPTIVVSSAALAKEVFRTHDLESSSRPYHVAWEKLSYGKADVAFAVYGDSWRYLRKICMMELLGPKMVDSFQLVRQEEVERTMRAIASKAAISRDGVVDLTDEIYALSTNIVCRLAFGRLYQNVGENFHSMLTEVQENFMAFFFADYLPILGWIDVLTGKQSRLEQIFVRLDRFYQKIIDEHIDQNKNDPCGENFVDSLLRLQHDEKRINFDQIKGVLMNIFVAGTDTSAATVEWAMTELMRHPEILKKVQDEVRGIVGTKGKVEEGDTDQLHYIKCIVKETMRLHPAAPMLVPRETTSPFKLDQYDIPAKTTVLVNAWAIARDPSYWPYPDEFKPDRFINGMNDPKGEEFNLIPFGEGRRICPGKNFSNKAVELMLANLLYSFDWSLPDGVTKESIDMSEGLGITVQRAVPLCLVPVVVYQIK